MAEGRRPGRRFTAGEANGDGRRCLSLNKSTPWLVFQGWHLASKVVVGDGFEPSKALSRRIYSPPSLAT